MGLFRLIFGIFFIALIFSQNAWGLLWTVTQHDNSNCGSNCRWYINSQNSSFGARVEDDSRYGAGGIVAILDKELISDQSAVKISFDVENVGYCAVGSVRPDAR